MCGDIELNHGPRSLRHTKITEWTNQGDDKATDTGSDAASDSGAASEVGLNDIMREIRDLKTDLKQQFDKSVNEMYGRVEELKEEVTTLRNELKQSHRDFAGLAEQNKILRDSVNGLSRELDDMKGRMKRDNLIFFNVDQASNETWEESENKVKAVISEQLGLNGEHFEFDRVHRLTNAKSHPQPIIAKFARYKQRDLVLQRARSALKNSTLRISEDFSPKTRETRKKLGPFLKKAREEGKRAFLNYDKLKIDGTLYIFDDSLNDIRAIGSSRR
ncbi:uncharacterized protein [Ptychodera flava]|uniref:uncharacterized protein n=1 Tax=Ptychodera flava TaxID=63121 RepID=UPI00396A5496